MATVRLIVGMLLVGLSFARYDNFRPIVIICGHCLTLLVLPAK
jgi:hypothetical protein